MDFKGSKMLVITAHPGDLLWRCSGTVAKHIALGGEVHWIMLTYGIGAEANEYMRQPNASAEECKKLYYEQAVNVTKVLGISKLDAYDLPSECFQINQENLYRLAKDLRTYQPDLILTHHRKDLLNADHGTILDYVIMAGEIAGGYGIEIKGTKPGFKRAPIFCFEHNSSEFNEFNPTVFIDITEHIDKKMEAMQCFPGKAAFIEGHINRAKVRAYGARNFGRKECIYAEAFQAVYPMARNGYFAY